MTALRLSMACDQETRSRRRPAHWHNRCAGVFVQTSQEPFFTEVLCECPNHKSAKGPKP